MTPETEGTTHYFWSFCRNYNLDDQRITTLLREGVTGVFAEDEDILAAQQQAVEQHPDKQFYNLNIDGGAMWARRLIDKLMAAEATDGRYDAAAQEADVALAAARGDGPGGRSERARQEATVPMGA
jgi:vanillate O-demethylase monooxygenase subunit